MSEVCWKYKKISLFRKEILAVRSEGSRFPESKRK
jgi:hypothetical protein